MIPKVNLFNIIFLTNFKTYYEGCQRFSTIKCKNKVYTVPCIHISMLNDGNLVNRVSEKIFFWKCLYTIVHYGVHNVSPVYNLLLKIDYFSTCMHSSNV